jgi:predicted nucleotidyltransferase component of viral defense system
MTRKVLDLAASVRDRLLQRAHRVGEDFQLTLQRYAVERLLFRLSRSEDHDNFVLKGAMLYAVWGGEVYRPTRDLDLLGYGVSAAESLAERFRALCIVTVPEDGLNFLPETVQAETIRELSEHGGVRVRLEARLAAARIRLQVDVGFGDVVMPAPEETTFPTLLEGPAPRILAYTRESVVAEKLHAVVWLGDANTRLKDFYDLFAFSAAFSFESGALARAIDATFRQRQTPLPEILPLQETFFADQRRGGQWRAYLSRNGLRTAPETFTVVGEALRDFLSQPYDALLRGIELPTAWSPGGPWVRK